jgi:uncharacterized iron-regulated membrane protein
LTLGVLIALIGLSGSLIVFEDAIDEAFNPELYLVEPGEEILPFDDLAAAATAAFPDLGFLYLSQANGAPETSIFALMAPQERGAERTQVFLNPYTGAVLGDRPEHTWLGAVHAFHSEFLAGPAGEAVVGALALILVVSLSGGLILWWPSAASGWGGWKRALTVKASGTAKRLMRDLHNVTGATLFVVLFVCSLTALPLIWPDQTKTVLSTMLGEPPVAERPRASTPSEDGNRISLGDAVEIARTQIPGYWVNLALSPRGPTGFYMVRQVPDGDVKLSNSKTLLLDQYSGEVLALLDTTDQHIVDALASDFAGTIHNGSILGIGGRWLVFLGGLAFPLLFVTGVWLWYKRGRSGGQTTDAI